MKTEEYNKIAIAFEWWCAHGAYVSPAHCDDLRSFRRDLQEALNRAAFSSVQLPKVKSFMEHIERQIVTLDAADDYSFKCTRCGDRVSKNSKSPPLSPMMQAQALPHSNTMASPPKAGAVAGGGTVPIPGAFLHSCAWGCSFEFENPAVAGGKSATSSPSSSPLPSLSPSTPPRDEKLASPRPSPIRLDIVAAGNPSSKPKRYHRQTKIQEFRINRLSERIKRRTGGHGLVARPPVVPTVLIAVAAGPTQVTLPSAALSASAPPSASAAPANVSTHNNSNPHTSGDVNMEILPSSSSFATSTASSASSASSNPILQLPRHPSSVISAASSSSVFSAAVSTAAAAPAPAPFKSEMQSPPAARNSKVARPHRFATPASAIAHNQSDMMRDVPTAEEEEEEEFRIFKETMRTQKQKQRQEQQLQQQQLQQQQQQQEQQLLWLRQQQIQHEQEHLRRQQEHQQQQTLHQLLRHQQQQHQQQQNFFATQQQQQAASNRDSFSLFRLSDQNNSNSAAASNGLLSPTAQPFFLQLDAPASSSQQQQQQQPIKLSRVSSAEDVRELNRDFHREPTIEELFHTNSNNNSNYYSNPHNYSNNNLHNLEFNNSHYYVDQSSGTLYDTPQPLLSPDTTEASVPEWHAKLYDDEEPEYQHLTAVRNHSNNGNGNLPRTKHYTEAQQYADVTVSGERGSGLSMKYDMEPSSEFAALQIDVERQQQQQHQQRYAQELTPIPHRSEIHALLSEANQKPGVICRDCSGGHAHSQPTSATASGPFSGGDGRRPHHHRASSTGSSGHGINSSTMGSLPPFQKPTSRFSTSDRGDIYATSRLTTYVSERRGEESCTIS